MTRRVTLRARLLTLVAAFLLGATAPLCPLDLGLTFGMGNLGIDPARELTDTSFPGTAAFLGPYVWGASLYGRQPLTETIRFEAGFTADPVLRNQVYALISYSEKVITIGVGPYFGLLNLLPDGSGMVLKPGLSAAVQVELPGIAFVRFRSDGSIGGELVETGNYLQERSEVGFGFYVHNAIWSLNLETKKLTFLQESYQTVDAFTSYSFRTDIFQKNVPFRVGVAFSYQTLSRTSYTSTPVTDTLNSVVASVSLELPVASFLTLSAAFDGSVYDFGQGQLAGGKAYFLFRGSTGIRLNLDSLGVARML